MEKSKAITMMSLIFDKLWLPQNDYKKCSFDIIYPWLPTLDLIKLDDLLLDHHLYNDEDMSMESYVKSRLNDEELEAFTLLFLT